MLSGNEGLSNSMLDKYAEPEAKPAVTDDSPLPEPPALGTGLYYLAASVLCVPALTSFT